jgi:uncharacterized hydrophobic protein (TIGR00271 family)
MHASTVGGRRSTIVGVVHLRIVVPSYQSEHVLDLLEASETVINVIFLERAARKPEGDVILCDVPRDATSLLIADLRELDVDVDGSITIEEAESVISQAAVQACKAAKGGSDPVVWEEVAKNTSENVELSNAFLLFMVLSMMIASVGIYFDQPILIVGAMIVGPEFGPVAAACVAVVNKEWGLARRSIRALVVGFPLGIVTVYLATLFLRAIDQLPETIDFDHHVLTRFISSPDVFSFYVAAAAGVVGLLSLTTAKSSALVGVLVSVTTIPAAANVGVAAAYQDWSALGGAAAQLAINLTTIFIAGVITLFVQRRLYMSRRRAHLSEKARSAAGLPVGTSRRAAHPHEEPEGT